MTFIIKLPIGTFTDFDTASAVSSATLVVDSGTDTIRFNNTAGDVASVYVEYDIGNSVPNTVLKQPVFCIQDAGAGTDALEGTEITSLQISHISGTNVDTKGALAGEKISQFQASAGSGNYVCNLIADEFDNVLTGRYRFTFTLDNTTWTHSNEKVKFCLDDLGNYGAMQYPDANAKATASCVTFDMEVE